MNPKANVGTHFPATPLQANRRTGLTALAFGLAVAMAPLASRAQALDIKTGAWEATTTTSIEGMLMPKEMLEKMPPERRARFEQQMRARAAKPTTHTTRNCVTKEKLDRSEVLKSENPKCTRKVISHSARAIEVEETCPPPRATKSHFKLDAKSPESYVGVMDIAQSEGGKVHIDMKGQWLSAVCKKGVDD
jgi:hypothetical protein